MDNVAQIWGQKQPILLICSTCSILLIVEEPTGTVTCRTAVLLIVEEPTVTVKCRTAIICAVPLLEFMSKSNVE